MGDLQMTSTRNRDEMPRHRGQPIRDSMTEGIRDVETTNIPAAYLRAATQIQRWRDFGSHAAAYVVMNVIFVVIWVLTGGGFFLAHLSVDRLGYRAECAAFQCRAQRPDYR